MSASGRSQISLLGLVIWLLAALFFLYEFFLRTFVGTLAYQIIPDMQLTPETFALVGSAYYVAYALMQVPVGVLADKFGVKRIMIFAALVCAISTYAFSHANTFTTAFFSRLAMGFGSSFAFVCLLVIAATWFPRKFFAFFAGLSQFVGTMGPMMAGGPLVALMAVSGGGWRSTLSDIAGFGVVLAVLILFIVRKKPRGGEQVFIYLQASESLAKRLMRLIMNKQAWFVAAYSAMVYASIALLAAAWGTSYLMTRGLSQAHAADMISVAWFSFAIACPLLGALSDLMKRRKPVLIFSAVLGFVTTIFLIYFSLPPWGYVFVFIALGFSAAGQSVGFAAITEHVDLSTKATALGLNNGAITIFGAIVPPLVSYLIMLLTPHGALPTLPSQFIFGFSVMPIFYFISLWIALFCIKETYCKPQKETLMLRR